MDAETAQRSHELPYDLHITLRSLHYITVSIDDEISTAGRDGRDVLDQPRPDRFRGPEIPSPRSLRCYLIITYNKTENNRKHTPLYVSFGRELWGNDVSKFVAWEYDTGPGQKIWARDLQ